jgi:hypothetical protein
MGSLKSASSRIGKMSERPLGVSFVSECFLFSLLPCEAAGCNSLQVNTHHLPSQMNQSNI